jgi:hypothetical protein
MAEGLPATPTPPVRSAGMKLDTLAQPRFDALKAANASIGVMSPVSQNGCFEFDRIIKAGNVVKRTRKTRVSIQGWSLRVAPAD